MALSTKGKKKIISILEAFFAAVEDLFDRYPPSSDFNKEDFVKESQKSVQLSIEGSDLFSYSKANADVEAGVGTGIGYAAAGLALGLIGISAMKFFNHSSDKNKFYEWVASIRNGVDPDPYLRLLFP